MSAKLAPAASGSSKTVRGASLLTIRRAWESWQSSRRTKNSLSWVGIGTPRGSPTVEADMRPQVTTVFLLFLALAARADQQAVCHMDDNVHSAEYKCPDGYSVTIAGEHSKTCTGSCYKKSDSKSLEKAIAFHAAARHSIITMDPLQYEQALKSASDGKSTTINTDHGSFTICAPEEGKCPDDERLKRLPRLH
jgi:hypothetical protein